MLPEQLRQFNLQTRPERAKDIAVAIINSDPFLSYVRKNNMQEAESLPIAIARIAKAMANLTE